MEDQSHPIQADNVQSLRNEPITLAEKQEIKHSVAYIKKASHSALEKIKGEYERIREKTIRRDQRISD